MLSIPLSRCRGSLPALILGLFLLPVLSGPAVANVYDEPVDHPAIPLLDESGGNVLDSGKPYSTRMSCGGAGSCHDYDTITHAHHFEAGRDEATDDFGEKRGLPQLIAPGYFGGFNCMGGSNPTNTAKKSNANAHDFADYGSPGLVKRCATCHSGGGWMEKDRNGNRYDEVDPAGVTDLDGDYFNRGSDENNDPAASSVVSQWDWQKSGVVENDCLLCHLDFTALKRFDERLALQPGRHDPPGLIIDPGVLASKLRVEMIGGRGHFRYGNTAILEYLNTNTSGDPAQDLAPVAFSRTDGDTDNVVDNSDLDLDDDGLPVIQWDTSAFDTNRKITIPMLRFGANDNCMACHRTSNSRRGFYGFGEGAEATYDEEDGTLVEDYRDDVHKGESWVENGESRTIENCNVCHSREYFKPADSNVNLDASHDFLKGNSDMDVRNDLDYNPNAKSCEYCHNDAPNSDIANPNGYEDMLSAHEARWTLGGDMAGYPQDTLSRITQTHLDVISCQACHITGKSTISHGHEVPLVPMYRYREAEDGQLKIVPYKPKTRSYWQDQNSGRVLNKFETGEVSVNTRPTNYDEFVTLKNAYDDLLQSKGIENPDIAQVVNEINHYIISHNTSPSVSSVQCEECHNTKSDGSFSSLVSPDGLLGEDHTGTVTTVVDPLLVQDGLIVMGQPYMQVDATTGIVTENVSDILSYSRVDPSMTALKPATATAVSAAPVSDTEADVIANAGIWNSEDALFLANRLSYADLYLFQSGYGDDDIRDVALMVEPSPMNKLVFPNYTMRLAIADSTVDAHAADAGLGNLAAGAQVFSLQLVNISGMEVSSFNTPVLVKLPYSGTSTDTDQINIITSSDGENWSTIGAENILIVRPGTDLDDGYIVFQTTHFSYFTTTEALDSGSGDNSASTERGGGSIGFLFLLFGLMILPVARLMRLISTRI